VSDRYHRQVILPQLGAAGQERLTAARLLIVGCGALGCAAADLLARAGVGTLRIVDRDVVERTNLQRQVLFDERDAEARAPKAHAAAARLAAVNRDIRVDPVIADIRSANVERLATDIDGATADAIVDGTDNFETRYLLNDVAAKHGLPLVYGGAVGVRGVVMPVLPRRGPCLRCIWPEPPASGSQPTCDTAGVLGAITSVVGALEAALAIRLIAQGPERIEPALSEIDAWTGETRRIRLGSPVPACPCCGDRRFDFLAARGESEVGTLCGRDAVQVMPAGATAVDLAALERRLSTHGDFRADGVLCRGLLAREPADAGDGEGGIELTVFGDGRAIVRGTRDAARARALYARYVGS